MRHRSGIQMFSPIHFPSGPAQRKRRGHDLFASSPRKEGRKVGGWVRPGVSATSAHGCLAHVLSHSLLRKLIHIQTQNILKGQIKTAGCQDNITSFAPGANKISENHGSPERLVHAELLRPLQKHNPPDFQVAQHLYFQGPHKLLILQ